MDTVIFGGITVGTALGFLAGGLGVSVVAQVVKRVFKLESSKVIQFMVFALSVAGSVLADVISAVHGNAALLGSHAVGFLGVANAAHTFIVSDADQFVQKVKVALNDEATKTTTTSGTSITTITAPVAAEGADEPQTTTVNPQAAPAATEQPEAAF